MVMVVMAMCCEKIYALNTHFHGCSFYLKIIWNINSRTRRPSKLDTKLPIIMGTRAASKSHENSDGNGDPPLPVS